MTKSGRISVLMPVRNAEPFLEDCIDSIRNQTETNWELIAVDDHSTDNSKTLLKRAALEDSRIVLLPNQGQGIIHALRTAYANAQGVFITRMDADDIMAFTKLEMLKTELCKSGPGHIAVGLVRYFSDDVLNDGYKRYETWLNQLTSKGINYSDIYKECVIPSPCWMVYREDLEASEAFEPDIYPEDYDLCFRFYQQELTVVPVLEPIHLWRDHSSRSSRTDSNYADNRFLELKVNWFLKLDRRPEKKLVLWGAGSKGKSIAQLLTQQNTPFIWVCNNESKWGKEIHGVTLNATEELEYAKNVQVIVVVANPDEQQNIRQHLSNFEHYFFC